jgi:hypothetical protein
MPKMAFSVNLVDAVAASPRPCFAVDFVTDGRALLVQRRIFVGRPFEGRHYQAWRNGLQTLKYDLDFSLA